MKATLLPRFVVPVLLTLVLLFPRPALSQSAKEQVAQLVEQRQDHFADVAHQIWGFAELGYQETRSSALLQKQLRDAGFRVKAGVAGLPTAFVAEYGSGKPVVAFMAEFDALPGLSQQPVPERKPVTAGAPGHGCGHNLLGTASVDAALAVRDWLASSGTSGTVRVYGTPAEEGGSGKVYMARAGLFDDADAVLSWHPGDANDASPSTNLALISAKFRFHGVAAHAAAAPDKGRSALDAVEAMDAMVNLLREHVPQETRIHYVITDGGGAPNVVPAFAEVYYYVRSPDVDVLRDVFDRVVKASEGAALGTGTTVDHEILGGTFAVLPNDTLQKLVYANLRAVGGVHYTDDEQAFADSIRATIQRPRLPVGSQTEVQPYRASFVSASTDAGDVSWIAPLAQLTTATWVPGTAAHTWQATALDGMSIGAKGMEVAARTLAMTAVDLFTDPAAVAAAHRELVKARGADFRYVPLVGDRKPALDYR